MPNMKERMRLKDRILENVGKAVRFLQDCQSKSGDESLVLINSDWQLHKLVEHLDHAFLHGLRHITDGYWVLVREFTNKSTVKDIDRLYNVTTNLGRGRAWLYQALNDQLLESYTKCYLDNQKLVTKYYVKEALVLDEQRLQILLTLASGLEMICFHLEIDVPYLDLATYIKSKNSGSEDSEDRISLSSADSSFSQCSSVTSDPFDESNTMLPSRTRSTRSYSIDHLTNESRHFKHSLSLPIMKCDYVTGTNRETSLSKEANGASVEVFHLPSKGSKGRKKKPSKKKKVPTATLR